MRKPGSFIGKVYAQTNLAEKALDNATALEWGKWLNDVRINHWDASMAEMGKMLDVPASTIHRWETEGVKEFDDPLTLQKLSRMKQFVQQFPNVRIEVKPDEPTAEAPEHQGDDGRLVFPVGGGSDVEPTS